MFDIIALTAKIYFSIGVAAGIVSIISFFNTYETSNIDKFIESVKKKQLDTSRQLASQVEKLRDLNIPESMLNTLPYLGIMLHSIQAFFIWPWQLYKLIQKS